MSKIAEKVPGWVERLLFPRLALIEGDLKALHSEIGRVDTKVDSLRNEMNARFEAVEGKFEAVESKIESVDRKVDSLEKRFSAVGDMMEIRLRLSAVEKRLGV